MNKARRKELAKATSLLWEARGIIEEVYSDEEDAKDNIPENLHESERYEKAEEAVYELENIVSEIEDIEARIEEL
jgi:exonuclease VII small subunit|tara:strand:+ start:160 stop:384 length:225 start_codon:yes stop_codon:yes gene_type:complete